MGIGTGASIRVAGLVAIFSLGPIGAHAVSNGYTGVTLRDGSSGCGGCHASNSNVQVHILGSASLAAGIAGAYTIRARNSALGAGAAMGFAVAATDSPSPLSEGNLNTTHNTSTREVHHNTSNGTYALNTTSVVNDGGVNYGTASYAFTFTMPAGAAAGSAHVLNAIATLGVDSGPGAQTQWNNAAAFTIYVPPAAPSTLSNSGAGPASVNFSWSGGGPNYRVVYKTGAVAPSSTTDGTFVDLGAVTATTLSGLSAATQYSARLYSKIAGQPVFSTTGPTTTFTTLATASTSTALASDVNPALVGQMVTFGATVTSPSGTPTGGVTFKDGALVICNAVALSGGSAACATAALTAGTHSITAEYGGVSGFNASTSSPLSQVVRNAEPRYVNAAAGVNAGGCTSPASPCRTITYAMAQAVAGAPGDAVIVAPGTYNVALGETFPIVVKSGVQLQSSGHAGNTTLDATGANARVLSASGTHGSTLIEGFTITGGLMQADGFGAQSQGGGLVIFSGSPTVRANVFAGNQARGHDSAPSSFDDGGSAFGGGIYTSFGAPTIVNNVFRGNTARGGTGSTNPGYAGSEGGWAFGGGLYRSGGGATIANNTFHGNSAIAGAGGPAAGLPGGGGGNARGGGIDADDGAVINNILSENAVTRGTGGAGSPLGTIGTGTHGGMYHDTPANATNNLFHGNTENSAVSTGDTLGTNSRCFLSACATVGFHAPPGNLRIAPSSPAAGQGTAMAGTPVDDHDGATRPNPPAIGAFEPATAPPAANIGVTQVASPGNASTGKDVILTLTVSNAGPAQASGVTLTSAVPVNSTFVWTLPAAGSPGCSHASGMVTCSIPPLAVGANAAAKIVLRPIAAGSIQNVASVSFLQPDTDGANNSSSLTVNVAASTPGTPIQRYRLYSDVTKEHHFTTDLNEYNVLGTYVGTWVQEGGVGKILNNPGPFGGVESIPYYRLYDNGTRWHHWTTDANEYYTLGFVYAGWNMEGVDGWILPTQVAGTTQLYRLNYPALGALHHWTIDANEYNTLITPAYGWVGEGGSGFVIQ